MRARRRTHRPVPQRPRYRRRYTSMRCCCSRRSYTCPTPTPSAWRETSRARSASILVNRWESESEFCLFTWLLVKVWIRRPLLRPVWSLSLGPQETSEDVTGGYSTSVVSTLITPFERAPRFLLFTNGEIVAIFFFAKNSFVKCFSTLPEIFLEIYPLWRNNRML